MTWVTPRTYIFGELMTVAIANEQWRDNEKYLGRIAGSPILNIGNAIAPLSGVTPAAIEQIVSSGAAPKPNMYQARFDAAADEGLMWQFTLPPAFTGILDLKIYYYMASASAGNVVFVAQVSAKSDADAGMTSRTFDAANSQAVTVPGVAGTLDVATITMTNDDGMAAGDEVILLLYRDANAGGDTAAGDCIITDLRLE